MALTSGFFNSKNHDRVYTARQMSQIFDGLISDGVYANVLHQFQTVHVSGMTVAVRGGRAWFNHVWIYNDSDYQITIDPADVVSARIDGIFLKIDNSELVRAASIYYAKGTPAISPVRPAPTPTADITYIPLSYITVPAGATSIDNIAIMVGTDACPYVTGIITEVPIDQWLEMFQNQFNEWFENLHYILDGDVAGHLQNEIDETNSDVSDLSSSVESSVNSLTNSINGVSTSVSNLSTSVGNLDNKPYCAIFTPYGHDTCCINFMIPSADGKKLSLRENSYQWGNISVPAIKETGYFNFVMSPTGDYTYLLHTYMDMNKVWADLYELSSANRSWYSSTLIKHQSLADSYQNQDAKMAGFAFTNLSTLSPAPLP